MSGVKVRDGKVDVSGVAYTPVEARELASELLYAADVADGREDPFAIYSREAAIGLWGVADASAKLLLFLLRWAEDPKCKLRRPEVLRAIAELGAEMDLVERFKRRGTRR